MLTDEQLGTLNALILEYGVATLIERSEQRPRQIDRILRFVDGLTDSAAPAEVREAVARFEIKSKGQGQWLPETDATIIAYYASHGHELRSVPATRDAVDERAAFDEIRSALDETYGFASTSPRAQENINFISEKLDEIEKARAALATAPTMSEGVRDVLAERRRQVEQEGWTPEHDDQHAKGEMAFAAASYAMSSARHPLVMKYGVPGNWPWAAEWWKPTTRRHDLVKAGALILAEIERIDRAGAKGGSDA